MFWTAVLYGLGGSIGASVGFMLFVVLFSTFKAFAFSKSTKTLMDYHESNNKALIERNEISEEQVREINKVAAILEKLEYTIRNRKFN